MPWTTYEAGADRGLLDDLASVRGDVIGDA